MHRVTFQCICVWFPYWCVSMLLQTHADARLDNQRSKKRNITQHPLFFQRFCSFITLTWLNLNFYLWKLWLREIKFLWKSLFAWTDKIYFILLYFILNFKTQRKNIVLRCWFPWKAALLQVECRAMYLFCFSIITRKTCICPIIFQFH